MGTVPVVPYGVDLFDWGQDFEVPMIARYYAVTCLSHLADYAGVRILDVWPQYGVHGSQLSHMKLLLNCT